MHIPLRNLVLFLGLCGLVGAATAAAPSICAWQTEGRTFGDDLIPRGVVRVGLVDFSVDPATVLRLGGEERAIRPLYSPVSPEKVSHLAFLHTFHPGRGVANYRVALAQSLRNLELPPPAPIVFTYEIHYEDGMQVDYPVRWAESIEDWYRVQDIAPMLWARDAHIRDLDPRTREKVVLYAAVWPNPRPDKPVSSVTVRPSPEKWVNYGEAMICAVTPRRIEPTGRTFVVDPSPIGSDGGPGTYEQPYATVQHALDMLEAGDTVYLRGGFYALNRVALLTGRGGEPDRWITVSAFPGETPVLDGMGVLYDASKPQFNGENEPGPPYQRDVGILAFRDIPRGHIRVQGLQVQHSHRTGISADGVFYWADRPDKPHPRGVDISFNTVSSVREMGINVKFWDDVIVIGNRVVRPHSERMVFSVAGDRRYGLQLPAGSAMNVREHAQEGIDLTNNDGFEIAYNEVYGGSKEAIDCISVQNGVIHHNLVDSALNGIYIDAWAEQVSNLRIYRNYIHNAFAGIPCATEGSGNLVNFEISENIIIDSHSTGIDITEATYKAKPSLIEGHRVHHNTVHRAGYHNDSIHWHGAGLGFGGFPNNPNVRDMRFHDNIITDIAHTPIRTNFQNLAERRIVIDHNLVWPDEDRLPSWIAAAGSMRRGYARGEKLLAADPLYVDPAGGDFRLNVNSPARRSGSDGSDLGALPYGVAWRKGYDWIGRPTAFYRGETDWRPVFIPREKFNTFRNNLQRPRMFQEGRYGEDLQRLPAGMQALDGVVWQIEPDEHNEMPNIITLRGRQSEATDRDVTAIPVGRKAARLAFLHTAFIAPDLRSAGTEVTLAEYVVHYADGTQAVIPVQCGHNIDHWSGHHVLLPAARVAWTIPTLLRQNKVAWSTLYNFEWANPHPDRLITHVDLLRVGDPKQGTVALFALSTAR